MYGKPPLFSTSRENDQKRIAGAPGGIGVREAVTVVILSASFDQKIILEAILLYRFVNVLGDIGGFLMADIIYTFSAKTQ